MASRPKGCGTGPPRRPTSVRRRSAARRRRRRGPSSHLAVEADPPRTRVPADFLPEAHVGHRARRSRPASSKSSPSAAHVLEVRLQKIHVEPRPIRASMRTPARSPSRRSTTAGPSRGSGAGTPRGDVPAHARRSPPRGHRARRARSTRGPQRRASQPRREADSSGRHHCDGPARGGLTYRSRGSRGHPGSLGAGIAMFSRSEP